MITFSLAWVVVTIIKQKDITEFSFSPVIFILSGLLDFLIVIAISTAFSGTP